MRIDLMQTKTQTGVSLVELMIGMVLGLIIIAGSASIFVANQRSAQVKRDLDNAQEAFRFAAYTISRVVKNSDSQGGLVFAGSDTNSLVVRFARGVNSPDCLGVNAAGAVTNTFTLVGDELRCDGQVLANGISALSFRYGVDQNDDGWISSNEYVTNPADWNSVSSVKIDIATATGLATSFVATSRGQILAMHAGTPLPPADPPEDSNNGSDDDENNMPGNGSNDDGNGQPGDDSGGNGQPGNGEGGNGESGNGGSDNDDPGSGGDDANGGSENDSPDQGNGGSSPQPVIGEPCPQGNGIFAGPNLCVSSQETAYKQWGDAAWGNGANTHCASAQARVPTENELLTLYQHRAAIGGFEQWNPYWSSDEHNNNRGKHVQFHANGPILGHSPKTDYRQVICVYSLN